MNCARSLLKSTSKTVGRLYRRNFSETAVHKNIWIEEHNGIKEDLTNRFEWNGTNIMNTVIFLGLIPGFIYLVGKGAQNVFICSTWIRNRENMKNLTERSPLLRPSNKGVFLFTVLDCL